MTVHCSTCSCADEPVPPPSTSSAWARREALRAAADAVRIAKLRRGLKYGSDETPATLSPRQHPTPHPRTAPPAAQGRETPTQPQPPGEERTRRDLT